MVNRKLITSGSSVCKTQQQEIVFITLCTAVDYTQTELICSNGTPIFFCLENQVKKSTMNVSMKKSKLFKKT